MEHEGKIKLHTISNPAISLYCHISFTQRSMTVVDPPTITQLQIAEFGWRTKLRSSDSSTIHTDHRWSPTNRSMASINFTTKVEAPESQNPINRKKWKTPQTLIYSERAKVEMVKFSVEHFGRKGLRLGKITWRPKSQSKWGSFDLKKTPGDIRNVKSCLVVGQSKPQMSWNRRNLSDMRKHFRRYLDHRIEESRRIG